MSERSVYLRDQAAKCRSHARMIGNPETQVELLKLAAEYEVRAGAIESEEKAAQQDQPRSFIATANVATIAPSVGCCSRTNIWDLTFHSPLD